MFKNYLIFINFMHHSNHLESSSYYMSIRGNIEATPQKVLNFTKKILAKEEMMTFSGIMNEALTMNEQGRKVLHENTIEQLDEFALLDKIKKIGVSNIDKKIRDKFIKTNVELDKRKT